MYIIALHINDLRNTMKQYFKNIVDLYKKISHSSGMKLIKNVRVIPTVHADCPANFEQLVDCHMGYEYQGDSIYIHRDWVMLADIDPEFKTTSIYDELWQLFNDNSEYDFVILQPR